MTSRVSRSVITGISIETSGVTDPFLRGFVTRAMAALTEGSLEPWQATRRARITAIRLFHELHGDMIMDEISEIHVKAIIEELCSRRVKPNNRQPVASSCISEPESKQQEHNLSANSIRRYISALASIWIELNADRCDGVQKTNPFVGHDLPMATIWKSAGLSSSEVERIFELPVFTRGSRPSARLGEACYWIPLLLLLTGAKPEQVARMAVNNFHDCLLPPGGASLTISCNEARKGERQLRTGRQFSSSRTFPLPKLLIDLGILEYVSWLRARGKSELFAELKPKGPNNERFPSFELWWEGHLRSFNVMPKGCRPARALQSTWITRARICGISSKAENYILGRKDPNDFEHDLSEQLALGCEILKLDTPSYDLSQIVRWSPE